MRRRRFLQMAAAAPALASTGDALPAYHVVTQYKPAAQPGMPGRYRGTVVRTHSDKCIDTDSEKVDTAVVREMM